LNVIKKEYQTIDLDMSDYIKACIEKEKLSVQCYSESFSLQRVQKLNGPKSLTKNC